jgi:hypothetical protein
MYHWRFLLGYIIGGFDKTEEGTGDLPGLCVPVKRMSRLLFDDQPLAFSLYSLSLSLLPRPFGV